MITRATEADIYRSIEYHRWKSALEIRDELSVKKEKLIILGNVYPHLQRLEARGFVEHRERTRPGSEIPRKEYRLTKDGLNARERYSAEDDLDERGLVIA